MTVITGLADLTLIAELDAHEGPTYLPEEDALYVTTVPRRDGGAPRAQLKRISLTDQRVSRVAASTVMPNGMTMDRDGTLLICEQGDREHDAAIVRFDPRTATTETVVDGFGHHPLNSPNDVRAHSDGSIWFTDPSYGWLQGFRPPPELHDAIYRFDPVSGVLTEITDRFDKPNGLAFSPDESVLYVTDSGTNRVYALENGRARLVLAPPAGAVDGITTDADGRIYLCAADGVHVLDPQGRQVGLIAVPGAVNLTFGGRDGDRLFITTDTAVVAAVLTREGA